MAADGTGVGRLTRPTSRLEDQQPAWSPSGDWIVFTRGGDFGGDLYAIRPDGTGLWRLTRGPELDNSPTWVPERTG